MENIERFLRCLAWLTGSVASIVTIYEKLGKKKSKKKKRRSTAKKKRR